MLRCAKLRSDAGGQNVFAQYLGYESPAHPQLPGTAPISAVRFDGKIASSLLKYSLNSAGQGTHPVEYRTYAYEPDGPLSETRRYQGAALQAGTGELDFTGLPFSALPVQTLGYAYTADGGGSGRSFENTSGTNASLAYAYQSGSHQLASVTKTVGSTSETSLFTYDGEGRLMAQSGPGAKTLGYDFFGMPVSITAGGKTQYYIYGPENFRVATYTEEASAITGKKVYVYEEGLTVAKEILDNGASVKTRVHLYGQGELLGLMDEETLEKRLLVRDHQGSVVQVVGDDGLTKDETFFADYGELAKKVNAGDALNPSEGWTGKEFDEDIGLTYFGVRFYDPQLGLWLTPDPAAEFFSPYSYVGGDPINFIDLWGLLSDGWHGGQFWVNNTCMMGCGTPTQGTGTQSGSSSTTSQTQTSLPSSANSSNTGNTASSSPPGGGAGNAAGASTGAGGGNGNAPGSSPGRGGGFGGGNGGLPSRGDYGFGYVGTVNFYRDYGIALMQKGGATYVVGQGFTEVFKNPVIFAEGFVINSAANWFPTNATEGALAGVTIFFGVRKVPGRSSIWSSTKSKSSVQNAFDHWTKHRAEFPEFQNSKQYVEGAKSFVTNPPSGALTKTRPNGEMLYYDPSSNTFGVKGLDGAPKTFFRPQSGIKYWNNQ